MTAKPDAPLHRNLFHYDAQLAHPGHELQGELPVVDGGEDSLVLRPDRFLQHHFWECRSHWGLDQMGSGAVDWHSPDYRPAFPGIFLRERGEHSRTRTHREIGFDSGATHRRPVRSFDKAIRA